MQARLADNIVFKDNVQMDSRQMTLKLTNCGTVDAPDCIVERHTVKDISLTIN